MNTRDDSTCVARQENRLRFVEFNEDVAWHIGSYLREMGKSRELGIAIDIYANGYSIFTAGLPGSRPDNSEWIRRKRNLVMRTHKSTYAEELRLQLYDLTLSAESGLDSAEFAASGGSFPINVAGAGVIGAISVSGLTSRDDHNLVVEALCHFLGVDNEHVALPPHH